MPPPSRAAEVDQCVTEAFRGRHEACCRAALTKEVQYDSQRALALEIIKNCAEKDRIDARLDQIHNHPFKAQIGMTAEQVKQDTEWGPPELVNRTETASGVREQWSYDHVLHGFLYFENGKLVAIQTQ
jgi:hypothetical protein